MKVKWHSRAKEGSRQVSTYIHRMFGIDRERIFKQKVDQTVQMIMRDPNIGHIDPLFSDRPTAYRSVIINGLSKMVYYIDGDVIFIAAFWDTRREPKNQASLTE